MSELKGKNKEILAYTAGIVDGEGCIGVGRNSRNNRTYFIRILVANTDVLLLEWLKQQWGGDIALRKHKNHQNWKPYRCWRISHRRALDFLRQIRPYLIIKQAQADLALQMPSLKKYRSLRIPTQGIPPGSCLSDDSLHELEFLKQQMHKLNQKGVTIQ